MGSGDYTWRPGVRASRSHPPGVLARRRSIGRDARSVRAGRPHSTKGAPMQIIHSNAEPRAIGPYSQAVKAANVIYTSGQVSLDPATGELVKGDFAAHVRRTLDNLVAVLSAAGAELRHVIKANVFVTDLKNFQTLNSI